MSKQQKQAAKTCRSTQTSGKTERRCSDWGLSICRLWSSRHFRPLAMLWWRLLPDSRAEVIQFLIVEGREICRPRIFGAGVPVLHVPRMSSARYEELRVFSPCRKATTED